jgi:hypothetical protein
MRLRKKHDALRDQADAIQKIKDLVQQQKAWTRYSKRSLAVAREGTDFVRALTDDALHKGRESEKRIVAILAGPEPSPRPGRMRRMPSKASINRA